VCLWYIHLNLVDRAQAMLSTYRAQLLAKPFSENVFDKYCFYAVKEKWTFTFHNCLKNGKMKRKEWNYWYHIYYWFCVLYIGFNVILLQFQIKLMEELKNKDQQLEEIRGQLAETDEVICGLEKVYLLYKL
jgi:hypothetical protein